MAGPILGHLLTNGCNLDGQVKVGQQSGYSLNIVCQGREEKQQDPSYKYRLKPLRFEGPGFLFHKI
jgi:hypothetical protein